MILATGPVDPIAIDILQPFGEVVVAPDDRAASLISRLDGAVALIVRGSSAAPAEVIRAGTNLKVIGRTGAGYETVDITAATERGIPVVYTPGASARAVAEAAMTFLLALSKRITYWDRQVKLGNWRSRLESRPGDLDGSTLGILGLGSIGRVLAELASPFRMKILAYDPYVKPDAGKQTGVEMVTLEQLLQESDFVSIHAPLTPETRGIINRQTLRLIKPGAFLVNLARGGLIDSLDTLYEGLQSGILAGVGLDVFEPEPPDVSHPIFQLENCLTSPHSLATSRKGMENIFRSMAEDMAAVLAGRRPKFVVNPAVFHDAGSGAAHAR